MSIGSIIDIGSIVRDDPKSGDDRADRQLEPAAAARIIRSCVAEYCGNAGACTFTGHASVKMVERNLTILDCLNTLAAGIVRPPGYERGTWRYRVETRRITVVVVIESRARIRIVRAWRKTR